MKTSIVHFKQTKNPANRWGFCINCTYSLSKPKTPALVQFYSPMDDVVIEVLATDWANYVEKGIMIPHTPKTQNQTRL